MDISVKKLSEILKIDPNALLEKMIAAGLPQKDIEDSVSTEDKQTLLSYIRSSKDSPTQEKKVEVPKELSPKKAPKTIKEEKPEKEIEKEVKVQSAQEKNKNTETKEKVKKSVNINGSIRVNDLARKLGKRGNEVVKKLVELGEMASLNDEVDQETAVLVSEESVSYTHLTLPTSG